MNERMENIDNEIEDLKYSKPKCDFEHIWNCALEKSQDCLLGYEEKVR